MGAYEEDALYGTWECIEERGRLLDASADILKERPLLLSTLSALSQRQLPLLANESSFEFILHLHTDT